MLTKQQLESLREAQDLVERAHWIVTFAHLPVSGALHEMTDALSTAAKILKPFAQRRE
jgi:hypothetical protein